MEAPDSSPKNRRYAGAKENKKAEKNGKLSDGPITPSTNIMEIVHEYPEAVPVLIEAGMHCIGCQLSMYDTLELGCQIHGMDAGTVAKLIKEMNERVKEFRK